MNCWIEDQLCLILSRISLKFIENSRNGLLSFYCRSPRLEEVKRSWQAFSMALEHSYPYYKEMLRYSLEKDIPPHLDILYNNSAVVLISIYLGNN